MNIKFVIRCKGLNMGSDSYIRGLERVNSEVLLDNVKVSGNTALELKTSMLENAKKFDSYEDAVKYLESLEGYLPIRVYYGIEKYFTLLKT